jgi:hypothetical protein
MTSSYSERDIITTMIERENRIKIVPWLVAII